MTEVPLFVPITEHQALADKLAARATPVDEIGAELEALRCLRECVEELIAALDRPGEVTHDEMSDALAGVRANLAELRELESGEG
jgi:hypothetical protein